MDKKRNQVRPDSFPKKKKTSTQIERTSGRVDTGSSSSTIPERATDRHTESTPKPQK